MLSDENGIGSSSYELDIGMWLERCAGSLGVECQRQPRDIGNVIKVPLAARRPGTSENAYLVYYAFFFIYLIS